jgi:D-glycero-D-manno-heptose 1,7-bisphosphate phosphatase
MINKAVFLDRDGVLNKDFLPYQHKPNDYFLNEGVIEALLDFQKKGYLLIIISNQGGIAKKLYSKEDADLFNGMLLNDFRNAGITIQEVYYCPHHPYFGKCICRKPESLMLEKAMARFNIKPADSWFIGDAKRDIEAGIKAGVNTIRMFSNSSLVNVMALIP